MPTNERHARRLLKSKRAEIYKRRPFTIRLLDREDGETQPIEYKCDTGYQHIGVSICTEKRELYNLQFDLLPDEAERHNDRRKYRNARRGRKRYRKARFNNRKGLITKDGFAPSICNKRDVHIDIFRRLHEVLPITEAVFEMGQFDTQVLKAVVEGNRIPTTRTAWATSIRNTGRISGITGSSGATTEFWKSSMTPHTWTSVTARGRKVPSWDATGRNGIFHVTTTGMSVSIGGIK